MEPEDGEISSSSDDEVYTPLPRPDSVVAPMVSGIPKAIDAEEQDSGDSENDNDSSDSCIKNAEENRRKKRSKRTVMLRVPTEEQESQKGAKFKKYNVWTEFAEEISLTEHMRGCDVSKNAMDDRNVENYDFHLVNGRKRRRDEANSDDELMYPAFKRGRDDEDNDSAGGRKSAKSRLGNRLILDLDSTIDRDPDDVGREMANKLFEEKDELLKRVVNVLGVDLATEIYKETQRIEADGGMMINSGSRRRTPGGVYLFLLKNHDRVTPADRKDIFEEERLTVRKIRKEMEAALRDRKVEELKQRLSQHENLPALKNRKDLLMQSGTSLNVESQCSNLSNPPPSPVMGAEQSPDYKSSTIINPESSDISVNKVLPAEHLESPGNALKNLSNSTEDLDFLDLNDHADMDFF